MSFFVQACVAALKEFPAVNAEIDGDDIVYKNFVHMGIAVGGPAGLVVPSRSGRMSRPGARMFTRKNVRPSCLGTSGSVRARQMAQSAWRAREVHTFWPVRRHPPSARSALVRSDARSSRPRAR